MKLLLFFIMGLSFNSFSVSVEVGHEFCRNWFPALVLGDGNKDKKVDDLLRDFYTDDATLIDPNFTVPQKGQKKLTEYYKVVMSKYPNWSFSIEKIYSTDEGFILHYSGRVPGLVNHFRGVDIIELVKVDGRFKINKIIGVYDRTPFKTSRE